MPAETWVQRKSDSRLGKYRRCLASARPSDITEEKVLDEKEEQSKILRNGEVRDCRWGLIRGEEIGRERVRKLRMGLRYGEHANFTALRLTDV